MSDSNFGSLTYETLIAYILPGLLLAATLFLFSLWIVPNISLERLLKQATANVGLFTIASLLLSIFIGLIVDCIAHCVFGEWEGRRKSKIYSDYELTSKLINDRYRERNIDLKNGDIRNLIIDGLFSLSATSYVYARRNWEYTFYEASRNCFTLWPFFTIVVFLNLLSISKCYAFLIIVALVLVGYVLYKFMVRSFERYLRFQIRLATISLLEGVTIDEESKH